MELNSYVIEARDSFQRKRSPSNWITYENVHYKGRHEPLIGGDLFDRVQDIGVIKLNGPSACRGPVGWLRSVIAGVGWLGCGSRRLCGLRA
jgi:hypothetical protein